MLQNSAAMLTVAVVCFLSAASTEKTTTNWINLSPSLGSTLDKKTSTTTEDPSKASNSTGWIDETPKMNTTTQQTTTTEERGTTPGRPTKVTAEHNTTPGRITKSTKQHATTPGRPTKATEEHTSTPGRITKSTEELTTAAATTTEKRNTSPKLPTKNTAQTTTEQHTTTPGRPTKVTEGHTTTPGRMTKVTEHTTTPGRMTKVTEGHTTTPGRPVTTTKAQTTTQETTVVTTPDNRIDIQLDLVFLLDSSYGLSENVFSQLTLTAMKITQRLKVSQDHVRIALTTVVNDKLKDIIKFNFLKYDDSQGIIDQLLQLKYKRGFGRTHRSLHVIRESLMVKAAGDREGVQNLLIYLSNNPTDSTIDMYMREVNLIKEISRYMIIAIGQEMNTTLVRQSVSQPFYNNFFLVSQIDLLLKTIVDWLYTPTTAVTTIETTGHSTEETTKKVTDETTEHSTKEVTDDTTEHSTKEVTDETTKSVTDQTTGQSTEQTTKEVTVTTSPPESDCYSDVVFVFGRTYADRGPGQWYHAREFIVSLVDNMKIGADKTRVAVVVYSKDTEVVFKLDEHDKKYQVIEAINKIDFEPRSGSNTGDALSETIQQVLEDENGHRDNVPTNVILLTDHIPEDKLNFNIQAIEINKRARFMVVAFGDRVKDDQTLKDAVTRPEQNNYRQAEDANDLLNLRLDINKQLCELDTHQCQMDLSFIVDHSGSINDTVHTIWPRIIGFLQELVTKLPISPYNTRVGVVSFGSRARLVFDFNEYNNLEDLTEGIQNIKYRSGNTNTSGALRLTRTQLFKESAGDRPGSRDVSVLITDGVDTTDRSKRIMEANKFKELSRLIGVGIGKNVIAKDMVEMVSHPSSLNFFLVEQFGSLNSIVDSLVNQACFNRTLPTTPEPQTTTQKTTITTEEVTTTTKEADKSTTEKDEKTTTEKDEKTTTKKDEKTTTEKDEKTTTEKDEKTTTEKDEKTTTEKDEKTTTEKDEKTTTEKDEKTTTEKDEKTTTEKDEKTTTEKDEKTTTEKDEKTTTEKDEKTTTEKDEKTTTEKNEKTTTEKDEKTTKKDYETTTEKTGPTETLPPIVCEMDLAVIIDGSGSITENDMVKMTNWGIIKNFLKALVEGLRIGVKETQLAIVTFGTSATLEFDFTEYDNDADIMNAIDHLNYDGGSTNISGALRLTRQRVFREEHGMRDSAPNVVILMTDGDNTKENKSYPIEVEKLKRTGVKGTRIVGIGVTDKVNQNSMELTVSKPVKDNLFSVEDFGKLKSILRAILETACFSTTQTLAPSTSEKPETTTPEPETTTPRETTTTTPEKTTTTKPEITTEAATTTEKQNKPCDIDLAVLVDCSGSIVDDTVDNFRYIKEFLVHLVDSLDFNSNRNRISVVTFGERAQLQFKFSKYDRDEDIKEAIMDLKFKSGRTNTTGALRLTRTQVLVESAGDRESSPDVVILITDGRPNVDFSGYPREVQFIKQKSRLMGVGVSSNVDRELLKKSVSLPVRNNYFSVHDYQLLVDQLGDIIDSACKVDHTTTSKPETTDAKTTTPDTPTTTEETSPIVCEMDLVLMVDSSGSINSTGHNDWAKVLHFLAKLADTIDVSETHVAVVTFSNFAEVEFNLNKYREKSKLVYAMKHVRYDGGTTNTYAAARMIREEILTPENGDRRSAPNVVLLLTDGEYTVTNQVSAKDYHEEMRKLKHIGPKGTRVIGVGVSNANITELRIVVTDPNRDIFRIDQFDELDANLRSILKTACYNRSHTESPGTTTPSHDTTTAATITTTLSTANPRDSTTSATTTTTEKETTTEEKKTTPTTTTEQETTTTMEPITTTTPKINKNCRVDLALVIDHSAAIQANDPLNWGDLVYFVQNIVNRLPIGNARVAAVSFASEAQVNFNLDRFTSRQEVNRELDRIANGGKHQNITGALQLTTHKVFRLADGDRSSAHNVALLIHQGKPDIMVDELGDAANELKNKDIRLMTVGVATEAMRRYVSLPLQDNFFTVNKFSSLNTIADKVMEQICKEKTTSSTTNDVSTTHAPPISECHQSVDVVVLMKCTVNRYQHYEEALATAIKSRVFGKYLRVGVVSFYGSDSIVTHVQMSDNGGVPENIIRAVRGVRCTHKSRHTDTAAAMKYTRLHAFTDARSTAQKVMLLMTDSSLKRQDIYSEALLVKDAGIHIIAVGVGSSVTTEDLAAVASLPSSRNAIYAKRFANLPERVEGLAEAICVEDACKKVKCNNGGSCKEEMGTFWCQCPPNYSGPNCNKKCEHEMDLAFAFDLSGHKVFPAQLKFAFGVIQDLHYGKQGSRVAALGFSDQARLAFPFGSTHNVYSTMQALSSIFVQGQGTNTADALNMLRTKVFSNSQARRKVAVVFVSENSKSKLETRDQAALCHTSNITILAVMVGDGVDLDELQAIATYPPKENIMRIETSSPSVLSSAVCNNRNECHNNPCMNGGTCIDIINGYRCKCRDGFSGRTCTRTCSDHLDIVLVIDSSGSIREQRFRVVIEFVVNVVAAFRVGQGHTHFGAVSFSRKAHVNFTLDRFNSGQAIRQSIKSIHFIGNRTNTAAALDVMSNEMFTAGEGDRPDAPNIAIVITDGNSNMNKRNTVKYAVQAKQKGIHIIVGSIGEHLNQKELRGIASEPSDKNLLNVNHMMDLGRIKDALIGATCNDKNECDANECRNGATCEDDLYSYNCNCAPGYTGKLCSRACKSREPVDVVLVVDATADTDLLYDIFMEFTKTLVQSLPFGTTTTTIGAGAAGEPNVRVGMVTFANESQILFPLMSDKKKITKSLSVGDYGYKSNLYLAMDQVNQMYEGRSASQQKEQRKFVAVFVLNRIIESPDFHASLKRANDLDYDRIVIVGGDYFEQKLVDELTSSHQNNFDLRSKEQIDHVASAILKENFCN